MPKIRLTKTELRAQQQKMHQLERYLPTLQLKKALLQAEVQSADHDLKAEIAALEKHKHHVEKFAPLLADTYNVELFEGVKIEKLIKGEDNIAGIEIPYLHEIEFQKTSYSLFDTPLWVDEAIEEIRSLISQKEQVRLVQLRKALLEKELKEVSIRVNLF